jgi:hypothetical protein
MKAAIALFLVLASSAFARKEKAEQNEIVESRNVPLAVTIFAPKKIHEVKAHSRLAFFSLRLKPFVAQTFDHSKTAIGMEITTTTTWDAFTSAPILMTADGKQVYSAAHDWDAAMVRGGRAEQTIISDVDLIRKISVANEVYLTVMFPGSAAPFDHMSFQLSTEQLEDVRLVLGLFASMQSGAAH